MCIQTQKDKNGRKYNELNKSVNIVLITVLCYDNVKWR